MLTRNQDTPPLAAPPAPAPTPMPMPTFAPALAVVNRLPIWYDPAWLAEPDDTTLGEAD